MPRRSMDTDASDSDGVRPSRTFRYRASGPGYPGPGIRPGAGSCSGYSTGRLSHFGDRAAGGRRALLGFYRKSTSSDGFPIFSETRGAATVSQPYDRRERCFPMWSRPAAQPVRRSIEPPPGVGQAGQSRTRVASGPSGPGEPGLPGRVDVAVLDEPAGRVGDGVGGRARGVAELVGGPGSRRRSCSWSTSGPPRGARDGSRRSSRPSTKSRDGAGAEGDTPAGTGGSARAARCSRGQGGEEIAASERFSPPTM